MDNADLQPGFYEINQDWIIAAIAIVTSILIAWFVDRVLIRQAVRRATKLADEGTVTISRATTTRVRFARRLITALILFIGVLIAISQFSQLSALTRALFASSAVLGIVIGIAGRTAFANPLAGLMLAITQPFRIGDLIEFNEIKGRVEDLTLTYTYMRAEDGRLVVIPNEMLSTGLVMNSSRTSGVTGEVPSVPLNTHES